MNGSTTFSGVISGGGGLEIAGGVQTLSGINTYSNETQIDNGAKLALKANGAIANSSVALAGAATLDISQTTGTSVGGLFGTSSSGRVSLGAQTLTITNGSFFDGVIQDGGIAGGTGGGLTIAGNAVQQLGGVNTYTGLTTINSTGELDLINSGVRSGSIATSSAVVNNGIFDISNLGNGVTPVSTSIQSLSGTNTGAVVFLGVNQLVLTNASGTYGGSIQDGLGGAGGSLALAGGMETLTGANTYSGGTTLTGGTLQLGNGGTNGSITGNVLDNATLAFDRSDNYSFSGLISGSGGVNQIGTGATTLTAANTYTGPTNVTAGTLAIASTGSITSNVTNSATFTTSGTVTGSLTNTGTVNANGGAINGAVVNNTNGLFNVGGTVTGNSTFANAFGATLAIGITGAYTLQGMLSNSGVVTVASGGQLTAIVGGIINLAGGTVTVATGGTVSDDLNNAGTVTNGGTYNANIATNTGSITNNGTWTGNVAANAGTITNNLTWTGTIVTSGTFTNTAGATVSGLVSNSGTASNAGTFNGGLTNTAGTFNNTGTINGSTTISGGSLFGTGSAGNLTIGNGAVFAPGNGTPGTSMTVNGSLAFSQGAFYQVAINPQTASFVNVTGTATLGGASVQAFFSAGSYVSKQYAIVSAAGGVGGTFGSQANTNLPAGFNSSLSYDATHAYLNLALNFTPPPVTPPSGPSAPVNSGLTINQRNVGNALVNSFNTVGTIPIVFGALSPGGLTQASGELPTATQQTTFDAMNLFMGLMTDPFMNRSGGAGSVPATGYAEEGVVSAHAATRKTDAFAMFTKAPQIFEQRWSTWIAGYGGSQSTDGYAVLGSNNTTSSVYGTAVGADYLFSPNTVAGFALAGGGTNFSVANSGSGHSDLFQAGVYVRHTEGPAYISAALAYGWQDITTNRTVTAAGFDQLRAEFDANAWSGRVEGGYRFVAPWTGGVGITPYAAGQFTTFDLPSYAESVLSGAGTFALAYGAKDVTDARSELGFRTDKSFVVQDGILTVRTRFGWAHDYDPSRSIAATFQALPGAGFVVNGAAQATDSALTTASIEMKWKNGWSAAATFEGEFSNVTNSYAGKGLVRYAW
ncbi:autotransporter outer membrane beta-barrel domain-containing protein [Bradyrhizobium sp. S69]|uniref:autotransporter outer membrane beta-barrel domain-containing protein n=1 Tax=Bradyrhizobium sp. S69 TaxID=1641856 RepID=UPI001AEDE01F|nr:autotransporter outer membrane beta-barrel domain-containing protein [Bradyrhizobium sp. S69]